MGPLFFHLVVNLGLSFDQVGEMTFPQILCLQHEGKPPRGAGRSFHSLAAVNADRHRQEV